MAENEIDTDYYENLVENCIWQPPEVLARAIGKGVIGKQTDQYGFNRTSSGIFIPSDKKFEKKYNFLEVMSVGEEVPRDRVDVGDIVMIQRSTAFRMANGIFPPAMWRIMYDTMHIISVYPNLVQDRLSEKYRTGGAYHSDIETEEYKLYARRYAERDMQVPSKELFQ
jgi:co-chaperonin GroES (HSP10)